MPGGGWLSAREADDLLRCYGIPMVEFRRAGDADAAVEAAAGLGGHVVIKADVPGLLPKSIRAAPAPLGHRGQPAADIGALRDTPPISPALGRQRGRAAKRARLLAVPPPPPRPGRARGGRSR
jgi:ATP-grasp domain-containing protein